MNQNPSYYQQQHPNEYILQVTLREVLMYDHRNFEQGRTAKRAVERKVNTRAPFGNKKSTDDQQRHKNG